MLDRILGQNHYTEFVLYVCQLNNYGIIEQCGIFSLTNKKADILE